MAGADNGDGTRLDRWLWAARFYRTRSLSAEAIAGGKVYLNGRRAKRAKPVHTGDELRIRQGPFEFRVIVRGLSERRGPAKQAQTLYKETADSKQRRAMLAVQLSSVAGTTFRSKGRPTKKQRREIDRLKRVRRI